jgi:hypothetical protein|uniref:Uncharacterized protein n=1 Tax=viral metagenome TaxID=1070528 RepID=A0A6C0BTR7_9ZZZZ
MRAFNNGKPQLSSSDRTRDIGVRNIYADTKSSKANATNYDGSIIYDTANSRVKRYQNYEMYRAVNYGYSLCEDCSGVCPAVAVDPEIQTENNQFSIMTFTGTETLISPNDYLVNGGANLDGSGVFIDPSGVLFGTTPCTTKAYMSFMRDLSGIDVAGNDTNQNYLRCYSFPNKVKL